MGYIVNRNARPENRNMYCKCTAVCWALGTDRWWPMLVRSLQQRRRAPQRERLQGELRSSGGVRGLTHNAQ